MANVIKSSKLEVKEKSPRTALSGPGTVIYSNPLMFFACKN
jgi:hypothetical protein